MSMQQKLTVGGGTDSKPPDLVFIDIALSGEDGYNAAAQIRAESLDTEIVFVTSHVDKMAEAFCYRPIGFLEKPVSLEKVREVIKVFCNYHWHRNKYYVLYDKSGTFRVAHENILYFESDNHTIMLYMSNGKRARFLGRLDDVETELSRYPYVRCHKSYLIRLDAIDYLDKSKRDFVLINGTRIPISKNRYQTAIKRFMNKEDQFL